MTYLNYKVYGLDCAEEVAIIKKQLRPLIPNEEDISFDLLNGKLIIKESPELPSESELMAAVNKTGLRTIPWTEHVAQSQNGKTQPFIQRNLREILCAASGTGVLIGTAFHGATHSWSDALGQRGEDHTYPWLSIALYGIAIVAGLWFVFPKAFGAIRRIAPDMNFLMASAVIGAVIINEWMEGAMVAFLFSLALLLETWSVGRARKAITSIMDLTPAMARYYCSGDGDILEKPVAEVPADATVIVRPGERIPLDGTITQGHTSLNEAPITGESMPVSKTIGDDIFAGTINEDGAIEFKVTRTADDTTLARIIRMVEEAQTRRAPSEQWIEKFARVYTPIMMALALLIAIIPPLLLGHEWQASIYQGLVILVIACPCALVISTPVSIVSGLTSAARNGVLIKGGLYLEAPARLKAVAFDKTGTLTEGRPAVKRIIPYNGHSADELLERAAMMEAHSDHPIAHAILNAAKERNLNVEPAEDFRNLPGKGAEARWNGQSYWLGSHRLLDEKGLDDCSDHAEVAELENTGHTIVAIGNEKHLCGVIGVADNLRDDTPAFVRDLHDAGIDHLVMLTGDNQGTADAIAKEAGITEVHAGLLPEDKVSLIEDLRSRYGETAMVGDGINDAPALAASSLGIAMGAAGSDTAIETADIALMSDDLSKLPWLIRHSRRTLTIIKQNIVFALGLKLIFIGLAMFGLATLWMAIAADMGASLLVVFNGLRLLKGEKS